MTSHVSETCVCPLCAMFQKNVANVKQWASERLQKSKSGNDEKLRKQRDYHEAILQRLRDKHASHIRTFDAVVKRTLGEAVDDDVLQAQYADELHVLNANLRLNVDDLLAHFKNDYAERTGKLEGFYMYDENDLSQNPTWDSKCESESVDSLVVKEDAAFTVVDNKSALGKDDTADKESTHEHDTADPESVRKHDTADKDCTHEHDTADKDGTHEHDTADKDGTHEHDTADKDGTHEHDTADKDRTHEHDTENSAQFRLVLDKNSELTVVYNKSVLKS
jgi:hypothetical protein